MKKLLALLLCLLLMFSFTGCGNKEASVDEPSDGITDNLKEKPSDKDDPEEDPSEGKTDEPEIPTDFQLNPYFLTFMGKTKGEIDGILGTPTSHSSEFGLTYYGNGVGFGYNAIGFMSHEEIPSSYKATAAYINAESLFYNCPSVLSKDDLKKLFPDGSMQYDEMEGINVFIANYKGISLSFDFIPSFTSDMNVFVKVSDGFTPISE